MNGFLCSVGFERPLVEEMGGGEIVCPGVVVGPRDDDFVFARQILPDAARVRAESIQKLAEGALAHAIPKLDRPWRLHAIVSDEPAERGLERRVQLIAGAVRERWRKRHWADGELLLQLLLASRNELLASVAPVGRWPMPFPAGRVPVGDDWDAPSSAFRKLEEALAWLGKAPGPGEVCVDLGAAPGGWSHVLAKRGARVVAVDRAELDPKVARRVEHIRRDGFAWQPEHPPVDWLVCDIIAAPDKSLALLERWLDNGWTRNLVFHLKFKGQKSYALAQKARARVRAAGFAEARVKHLFFDRNEVTVMAVK